ncbi:sialic acid-binding Ig-like lectin 10 isoform X1 [Xyrauchen texanus]|uniref:sialic acid-binding Ig-like lectin 10 isoform X1 n=1 Tax=Xyrauchen texanus TaxID=154827 RepID=UPI0022419B60|nr:sialic acid-binding Ig-like lectin 10 isoform X1 [Xyrauchen texanus]
MDFISSCVFLLLMMLNMSAGQNNKWHITFNPQEITAVPGLCALISCNFTYPDQAKPVQKILLYACNKNGCNKEIFNFNKNSRRYKQSEAGQIEMLETDPHKNNCSIIMKDINVTDEGEYAFRVEGSNGQKITYPTRFKVAIQEKPIMDIPPLRQGEPAGLNCSAPFPCLESPPDITWWARIKGEPAIKLKDNITLTTFKSHYLSTLALTPSSKLHNATVECYVTYGHIDISTHRTLEVMYFTNESKINRTISQIGPEIYSTVGENLTKRAEKLLKDTRETKHGNTSSVVQGTETFLKKLGLSKILTFLAGMACSAVIFSVTLCCWVSCHRVKKHKGLTANPDTGVNLEKKLAEEEEREPTDMEYTEINRDRRGNGKRCEDDQTEMSNGETEDQKQKGEEIYSNVLFVES